MLPWPALQGGNPCNYVDERGAMRLQLGLATLLFATVAPLGGALSFKKFGLINALPEALHGTVKYAHRKVRLCMDWGALRSSLHRRTTKWHFSCLAIAAAGGPRHLAHGIADSPATADAPVSVQGERPFPSTHVLPQILHRLVSLDQQIV